MLGNRGPVSAASGLNLYDCLLGSLDFDGNPRWLVNGLASSPADQEPRGLAVTAAGDVYVTGFLNGTGGLYASGGQNAWLARYSSLGAPVWNVQGLGHAGQVNAGWGVALDSAGCVYLTGGFDDSNLNFTGFTPAAPLSAPGGLSELFVVKYCPLCDSDTPPIVIVDQPKSLIVSAGGSATFSVTAGGSQALSYLWRFNGTNIAGATNATFAIAGAQESDAGIYEVLVSNEIASIASEPALLMIKGSFFIRQSAGRAIQMGWPPGEGWILQEAPGAAGPWSDSSQQDNPQEISPGGAGGFYRLRKP